MSDFANFFDIYPLKDIPLRDFNDQLFKKDEFHDKPPSPRLPHQHFIAQFMNYHTLYDEILLFHAMGTGKTCTAVSVCEELVYNPSSPYMRVFWIVPNRELIREHIREIVSVCTPPTQYKVEMPSILDDPQHHRHILLRRYRNVIRNVYQFETFDVFARDLKKMNPELWDQHYGNSVIIFDEAHHLIGSRYYDVYYDFLHALKIRKIILMTGTPMINTPTDFASLMNLILPTNLQMPTKEDEFLRMLYRDNQLQSNLLQPYIQGRVSYLKSDAIQPVIQGSILPPLEHTYVYQSPMMPFQESVYQMTVAGEIAGLYPETQQAALLVFPDGSIGSEGFTKYIHSRNGQHIFDSEMLNLFAHLNKEEKLAKIRQFSTKYATIIECILKNPRSNTFVYLDSIHEGGAIAFSCFLRLFKYTPFSPKSKKGLHFSILSSDDDRRLGPVLETFNSHANRHGQLIHVLIGGRKVMEGFTFRNIMQIHIVRPHWNFAVIDQAIGRSLRAFSHDDPNSIVQLYYHVITLNEGFNIDIHMYKRSEDKDRLIKQIEYAIKISAFDCTFFYKRNVPQKEIHQFNYSRFCEYKPCVYECISSYKPPYDRPAFVLPMQDTIDQILQRLKSELFITISSLQKDISSHRLISALQVLKDTYIDGSYFCIDQDIVFLAPTQYAKREDIYYIRDTYAILPLSFESLYKPDWIISMICSKHHIQLLSLLPNEIQHIFLKTAIEHIHHQKGNLQLANLITNYYKSYITTMQPLNYWVISLTAPAIVYNGQTWEVLKNKEGESTQKIYGLIERGKFKIVDTRASERARGQVASTMKLDHLQDIALYFQIPIEQNKKQPIIQKIRQYMEEKHLIRG